MGVTYTRRALKGGWAKAYSKRTFGTDSDLYYIGEPLESRVRTFIGIAGMNWGNAHCLEDQFKLTKNCDLKTGMFPGSDSSQEDISRFLNDLNTNPSREG